MYKVFGSNRSVNPSKDAGNKIGLGYDTLLEALYIAQNCPYDYVEILQPGGTVITLEEFKAIVPNFLLFAGDNYYPRGGYNDLVAKAATEDVLRDIIAANENKPHYGSGRFQWWQIVDANTHMIIAEGNC